MNTKEMEQILAKVTELAGIVYSKEPVWKLSKVEWMRPAKEKDIEKLSAAWPFPLPPSYRLFLGLHDGCLNLWGKFALAGTAGSPRDIVDAEVRDAETHQQQMIRESVGNFDKAAIRKYEEPDETTQRLYVPSHTVVGANKKGGFLLFYEGNQSASGEYEFIHYTYSGGAYGRYPDFAAYLHSTVDVLEKRIRDKGYAKG